MTTNFTSHSVLHSVTKIVLLFALLATASMVFAQIPDKFMVDDNIFTSKGAYDVFVTTISD